MAELDEERRALAERFRVTHAIENALTAQQARLFVRSIQTSWGVQPLAWTQRQSIELFSDARRLLHAAGIFEDTDGSDSEAAASCYRRAAELLEWLSRSHADVTREVPTEVLAAGAYQLAGLPAMATGILRRSKVSGVGGIISAFLACDFDAVLGRSATFWGENLDLTGRDGSARLLEAAEEAADESLLSTEEGGKEFDGEEDYLPREAPFSPIAWYVVVETVRTLGLLTEGLRRGEQERTGIALVKLKALVEVATRWANDETWVILRLVLAAAERFARNSLHRRAAALVADTPTMERLRRFAREQFGRGRGVLWASQIKGLERLTAGNAFALCTPTGSGKTMVANLALVKELLLTSPGPGVAGRLALYLVPSRALAGEVEAKLSAEFRGEDIVVTGLYSGTDWGITDNWLTTETPTVLIATVEKAEALMRYVGRLLIHRLALLIIDEAHQVVVAGTPKTMRDLAGHGDRSMRLESLVSRILVLKPDIARIALTAVAGGAAPSVSRWIEDDEEAVPVGLGYRSSRQLVGVLECRPRQSPYVTLELNNGQPLYVRGREEPVFLALSLPPMPDPPAGVRNSLHHYVQIHALWTALHLAPSGRRILISVTQGPDRVMRRYAEAFDLAGWLVFAPFEPKTESGKRLFDEARTACIDYCGASSSEVRLLDRGIATSHGQMPQRLRRLMVELIDKQVCPITVATATLTEGVNLPFDLIILPSLERVVDFETNGAPVSEVIPTSEFRNLAGRAGRPGAAEAMEGLTLVCLPMANSATAAGKQQEQRRQRDAYFANLTRMLGLLALEESADLVVYAPLQTLLGSIWSKLRDHLGLRSIVDLHNFLEQVLPEAVGSDLGVGSPAILDMLGDSLDELDGMIIAALDEIERLEGLPPAAVEAALSRVWRRTFTRYASAVEGWMEAAFIKRGQAVVERLYPDPLQRRSLYQIGFTPYVGQQFQLVSPAINAALKDAADYGRRSSEARFTLFWEIGELVRAGRGFGFTARGATEAALITRWHDVAGWWLQRKGAAPPAAMDLRRWQGFVANNLEFRLGVAVGAAVAEAWNAGAGELDVPSLETWRETSGLPWIGFWFRELLRWGTLDPFIAFTLAQGIVGTRDEGTARREEYEVWLAERGSPIADEDLIDPQLFLEWQRSLPKQDPSTVTPGAVSASFVGVDGKFNRYAVRPVNSVDGVIWIDPAGFQVAASASIPGNPDTNTSKQDYELLNDTFGVRVVRTY